MTNYRVHNQWMEPVLQAYLRFFDAASTKLVLDVGTRDGDDAKFFQERLAPELVVAIDANPIAAAQTRERYPDFLVLETAVSDYDGTTKFTQMVTSDVNIAGSSSIDAAKLDAYLSQATKNVIEVPVGRLDRLLPEHDVPTEQIDILKVDVEGFSYQCLVGMGDLLDNVRVAHLETEREATHAEHVNNVGVARLMRSRGFTLVGVYYEWGFGIQDQLWVNSSLVNDQDALARLDLLEI